jgi:hypothetical protein
VRVFGLDPVDEPVSVLSRIGYLSEEPDLPGWMRVHELIRYVSAFYPGWDHEYAERLRREFALDLSAKIRNLSKGQRARAGLLAALAYRPPLLAILAAAPLMYAIVCLLSAAMYGTADITSKSAGFPSHMLVLPVSTRALVGWPMLFGAGGVTLCWVLLASLFLMRAGVPVRLLWTSCMVCAVTAWLQAIDWWPFRIPVMRAVCTTLVLIAIGGFAAWASSRGLSGPVISGYYVIATVVAYAVARVGLSLARRGEEPGELLTVPARLARTGQDSQAALTGPK